MCRERAQRLTPIRRDVLEALLASHKPLGAYEIIERTAPRGTRPAPITVYRALDFLMENGLVHRIESRNAFVACVRNHGAGDLVVFLICERCGAVGEASSKAVGETICNRGARGGLFPEIAGDRDHAASARIAKALRNSGLTVQFRRPQVPLRSHRLCVRSMPVRPL